MLRYLVFITMTSITTASISSDYSGPESVNEAYVTGVGKITVGSTLIHKKFGEGVILSIYPGDHMIMAMVQFSSEKKPMHITGEHFSLVEMGK